jgi:hypothetical protein
MPRSGSGTIDDDLPLDHYRSFDDHRPLHDYRPLDHDGSFDDDSGWLSGINRTGCWSGDHASCETQKD